MGKPNTQGAGDYSDDIPRIVPDEWMANPLAGLTTEDNRPT
jgi:hypothetical protein